MVIHDRIFYVGEIGAELAHRFSPLVGDAREKGTSEDGKATCEIISRLIQEYETPMLYSDSNESSLIFRSKARIVAFAASMVSP